MLLQYLRDEYKLPTRKSEEPSFFYYNGSAEGHDQYTKDYLKQFKKDLSIPKSRRNLLFLFILVVTVIFAAITLNDGETEININYNSDTAHIEENINGTAKNIPAGDEIWIFVHPHTVNKYYPQSSNAVIQNEEWSLSSVHIGTENDTNQEFDIIVVLADTKAQKELDAYFVDFKELESGLAWIKFQTVLKNITELQS